MSDQANILPGMSRRQLVLFGGAFISIVLLLALGYALFLRPDYAVLAENLRPAEAAALVAELDKRATPYRLEKGGTTLLVPAADVDATRVAVAGADLVHSGQVGLELFNKSDMGLTNFAQKINYQRALQGELVRTLQQMTGVQQARVHLAMPERALFRGDRAVPRAAVSIMMRPGHSLTPDRVMGVQRLVAASVPDLPENQVVVLDGDGNVVSATGPSENAGDAALRTPESEEQRAVQLYFQARARRILEARLPGVTLNVRAVVLPDAGGGASGWAPAGEGGARNYALRLVILATAPLNAEDQTALREAVQAGLALDPARGDSVTFEQDVAVASAPAMLAAPARAKSAAPEAAVVPAAPVAPALPSAWWLLLLLVPAAIGAFIWSQRTSMSVDEQISFAERLKRQLNLTEAKDAAG